MLDLDALDADRRHRAHRRARERDDAPAACRTPSCPAATSLFFTFAATVADRRGLPCSSAACARPTSRAIPTAATTRSSRCRSAISLGIDIAFIIDTPLMWLDKAETWALTEQLGGEPLIELVVEHTHSCYLGDREHRHDWGYGCGMCPACDLRAKGYEQWQAARAENRRRQSG